MNLLARPTGNLPDPRRCDVWLPGRGRVGENREGIDSDAGVSPCGAMGTGDSTRPVVDACREGADVRGRGRSPSRGLHPLAAHRSAAARANDSPGQVTDRSHRSVMGCAATPGRRHPERHSEGEDPGKSSSLPDGPIIWPDPRPLVDWWDRVLGRPSTTRGRRTRSHVRESTGVRTVHPMCAKPDTAPQWRFLPLLPTIGADDDG